MRNTIENQCETDLSGFLKKLTLYSFQLYLAIPKVGFITKKRENRKNDLLPLTLLDNILKHLKW